MRHTPLLILAACAGLAGPAAAQAPTHAGHHDHHQGMCHAEAAQFAVGKRYTPGLAQRAQKASGASAVRLIKPGEAYTQDLRSDRLNLEVDRKGIVVRVKCF